MLVAKLGHEHNRVKTSVFSKSVGHQFEGLTVCAATVAVRAKDFTRVFGQLMSYLHLNAGTAGNKGSFFYEGTDDTEGIMKGSFSLFEDELIRATEKD